MSECPLPFIKTLLAMLEGKSEALVSIGVNRDDISLWLLYEYDCQCNLELSPLDVGRLSEAGITLCIPAGKRRRPKRVEDCRS